MSRKIRRALTGNCIAIGVALASGLAAPAYGGEVDAPAVEARAKPILTIRGKEFKDLNGNGRLDPYENWLLPTQARVRDLVRRMTLDEKVGMMLIDTLNAEAGGELSDTAVPYIQDEKMTRFIFRNTVTATPDPAQTDPRSGPQITPSEAAQFMNRIQQLAESTRLGIPAVFKSNARNHYERDPSSASIPRPDLSPSGPRKRDSPRLGTWISSRNSRHHAPRMEVHRPQRHVRLHGGSVHGTALVSRS